MRSAVASTRSDRIVCVRIDWDFEVAPYLWFPTVDVSLNYRLPPVLGGRLPTDVAVGPGDIFSHFDIGAMVSADARNGPFSLLTDFVGARFSATTSNVTTLWGQGRSRQFSSTLRPLAVVAEQLATGGSRECKQPLDLQNAGALAVLLLESGGALAYDASAFEKAELSQLTPQLCCQLEARMTGGQMVRGISGTHAAEQHLTTCSRQTVSPQSTSTRVWPW